MENKDDVYRGYNSFGEPLRKYALLNQQQESYGNVKFCYIYR